MSGKFAYDDDYYAWTREQARLLREAASERINTPIDWEHIAEELDIMGDQVRDAIESHLATVIEHLLKLEHSPDPYPRRKWRISVSKARRHLERKLLRHPSLKGWPAEALADAYADGRDDAVQDDSLEPDGLPRECPYTLDQIRDPDWWPASRHGLEG
ncbi:DUF29 domain-containing protein [Azospirillum sp. SYSU D00513]|uniref:DUF29 domain-containing protein n=1 Tax=Azospirillum sp. SYSU D00513 TaxID=2812561 RepID=UPI001A97AA1F|nr:DUF29 domain-containing protein [Azospirillum sp. SYSU D00513]